jgi:putative transposase
VLGKFKTFTSKRLYEMIGGNVQESRREWMIKAFDKAGKYNPLNTHHQFWQNGNYPVLLYTPTAIAKDRLYTRKPCEGRVCRFGT